MMLHWRNMSSLENSRYQANYDLCEGLWRWGWPCTRPKLEHDWYCRPASAQEAALVPTTGSLLRTASARCGVAICEIWCGAFCAGAYSFYIQH
jgi:hypothetical protein